MTSAYILIWVIFATRGISSGSAQFEDLKACEMARKTLISHNHDHFVLGVNAECMAASSEGKQ